MAVLVDEYGGQDGGCPMLRLEGLSHVLELGRHGLQLLHVHNGLAYISKTSRNPPFFPIFTSLSPDTFSLDIYLTLRRLGTLR